MFKSLSAFLLRGNVLDLAVGVIIAGAFGKIVDSLVSNIIMPVVGALMGGIKFSDLATTIAGVEIKYGAFVQTIVDFVIIGTVLFMLVKAGERFKKAEAAAAPAGPTSEALLADLKGLMEQVASNTRR